MWCAWSKPAIEALQSAASSRTEGNAKEIVPRTVTRIVLKEGGAIEADTAWEENGLVGYLIGNMQAFVESSAVERVMRGVTPGEEPKVKLGLRSRRAAPVSIN